MYLSREIAMATRLINRILYEGAYSSVISYTLAGEGGFTYAQKAYVAALAFGVVENYTLLDHYLDLLAKKRINKRLKTLILCAMYELEFMEDNANHISVNAYVNFAKTKFSHAAGFVNAVLRSFLRSEYRLKTPKNFKEYTLMYSHPLEIAKVWKKAYGEETAIKIMKSNQERAPIFLRLNEAHYGKDDLLRELSLDGVVAEQSPHSDLAFRVDSLFGKDLAALSAYKKGMFYVQDISSIVFLDNIPISGGESVLDLCGAPGGKGLAIAAKLKSGSVSICDISEKKLEIVQSNYKRLKPPSDVVIMQNDASIYRRDFKEGFDIVLADVPCSALGLIRKKPEIKYGKSVKNLKNMLELQQRILEQAAKYVKRGGILAYSTCTMNPEENSDRVGSFKAKHPEFLQVDIDFTGECEENGVQLLSSNGYSDGFFFSLMKKR